MHSIELEAATVSYQVRISRRASRLGITVHPGGRVVVTTPYRIQDEDVHLFIRRHSSWLSRALSKMLKLKSRTVLPGGKTDYAQNKERARKLIHERLAHFKALYHYSFNRVSIRNQSTRWGSCSRKGNLNFSYKLIHLPPEIADYVVVHELCHLAELNHSKAFWNLVAKTIPNHKELRARLRLFSH